MYNSCRCLWSFCYSAVWYRRLKYSFGIRTSNWRYFWSIYSTQRQSLGQVNNRQFCFSKTEEKSREQKKKFFNIMSNSSNNKIQKVNAALNGCVHLKGEILKTDIALAACHPLNGHVWLQRHHAEWVEQGSVVMSVSQGPINPSGFFRMTSHSILSLRISSCPRICFCKIFD